MKISVLVLFRDNKDVNLDNRQINMAMQREIRLRNRTINPPPGAFGGYPVFINNTSVHTASANSIPASATGASVVGASADTAVVDGNPSTPKSPTIANGGTTSA